jgi:hypothetical protein
MIEIGLLQNLYTDTVRMAYQGLELLNRFNIKINPLRVRLILGYGVAVVESI